MSTASFITRWQHLHTNLYNQVSHKKQDESHVSSFFLQSGSKCVSVKNTYPCKAGFRYEQNIPFDGKRSWELSCLWPHRWDFIFSVLGFGNVPLWKVLGWMLQNYPRSSLKMHSLSLQPRPISITPTFQQERG